MQQEGGKAGRFLDCSEQVIGACIEVHRHLGPGLLESAYEQCLVLELTLLGLSFERQRPVPIIYKGHALEHGYRLDVVVEGQLIVEIKATEQLLPVHEAQVLTYLKLTGLPTALLVNFGAETLRRGLRRLTNK
jgi:GxxExxY protein